MPDIERKGSALEAAGRALCDHANEFDAKASKAQGHRPVALKFEEWSEEYTDTARVAVAAYLDHLLGELPEEAVHAARYSLWNDRFNSDGPDPEAALSAAFTALRTALTDGGER